MKKLLLATAALPAFVLTAHAQEADGEEVVVTGQRAQQERAIEIKRNAIGIMDVAAADEIGRLPMDGGQGRFAVGDGLDVEMTTEQAPHVVAHIGVVVGQQHPRAFARRACRLRKNVQRNHVDR